MKTLLRTFAIALLATSVTGFAQPGDEKNADNNQTMTQREMNQREMKQNTKKSKKQAKPAKSKTNNDQDKAYDPTLDIRG